MPRPIVEAAADLPATAHVCSFSTERVRQLRSEVVQMPAELAAIRSSLDSSGTRSARARLPAMLRTVREAVKLVGCTELAGQLHIDASRLRRPTNLEPRSEVARHAKQALHNICEYDMSCGALPGRLDELRLDIWRVHARVRKAESKARKIRIFPLGDSITDGGTKQRSYRYHLHQVLIRSGRRMQWVGSMSGVFDKMQGRNASSGALVRGVADWPPPAQRHEGHWGWTSRQILHGHDRQPQRGSLEVWLRQLQRGGRMADVALVHIGTNDLTKYTVRSAERVSAISRRVATITQHLCASNARMHIVLAAPIPYCRFRAGRCADPVRAPHDARLACSLPPPTLSCPAQASLQSRHCPHVTRGWSLARGTFLIAPDLRYTLVAAWYNARSNRSAADHSRPSTARDSWRSAPANGDPSPAAVLPAWCA